MIGQEMINLLNSTKNGCNHNCKNCGLSIKHNNKQMCFYEYKKQWQMWNKQKKGKQNVGL